MFVTIKFETVRDIDVHELLCKTLHEGDDDALQTLCDNVADLVVVEETKEEPK